MATVALAFLLAIAVMVTSAQTCPPFTGFIQFEHPSRCSRSTLTTVCFCAPVSVFIKTRLHGVACGSKARRKTILQTCHVVVILKQRLASFQHLRSSSRSHLLDAEVSILNSFWKPKEPCVNVLRSLSYSQSIRQRIRRRTVTLHFNLHWNSQVSVHRSQS